MLTLVISCICLGLAVGQTPTPFPAAGGSFPFGGYPFYPGYGHYPYGLQQPNLVNPLAPKPVPLPKPIEPSHPKVIPFPQINIPKPHIGLISQQNQPYYPIAHNIPILRQSHNQQPGTGYQWDFSAANGIIAYENAEIVPVSEQEAVKNVVGGYKYTSPEGIPVEVTYTAGDHGFVPIVKILTAGYAPEEQK